MLSAVLSLIFSAVSGQIPPGYYTPAAGKTGEALQVALYNIIKGHTVVNYTPGVWDAFYTTDVKPNGKVWDMYSDVPGGNPPYEYAIGSDQCGIGGGGVEGDCYSREHSFPKSWFDDVSPMNTDLFHIFPTDQYVNNMHSNYPYAVVGTVNKASLNGSKKGTCATAGYTGTVFEPIDAYKGDFARAYFYMATRYENVIATWYQYDQYADAVLDRTSFPAFKTWYLNLLLSWNSQDPVSSKEIARNDSIYKIQSNRNPYIDHPEYVTAVWGGPGVYPEPVSYPAEFSAHNIHLEWVDATGAILPDGYLVRLHTAGFASIPVPVNGTTYPNSATDQHVAYGVQNAWFKNLNPNTTYYFKLFGYTGSGNTIGYKTDGQVPQIQQTTAP
jgi:endonuclease I